MKTRKEIIDEAIDKGHGRSLLRRNLIMNGHDPDLSDVPEDHSGG